MKKTTIKDIARELGVNPSTVSRALNNHPDIGLAMRAEVKQLAEKMHYRPNQTAVHLRSQQSRLIGLIVPEMTMFFYPSVIKGIQEALDKKGYHLVMLSSNESAEQEMENLRICVENDLAGVLISLSRNTKIPANLNLLSELDAPVVLFDKVLNDMPFDSILLADERAAQDSVLHLIHSGCTRIGGMFGNPNLLMTQLRMKGFLKGLELGGVPFIEQLVRFADNAIDGAQCARELMSLPEQPDGIFVMSDELIIGAYPPICNAGLAIPQECSVICISDGFLPYLLYPQVTYLHHDGYEMGKTAAERLLSRISNQSSQFEPETLYIQAKLIECASTQKVK
ncbi:MAG: LacI family DNA-binding transcriptional regulator [Saprospiraceae bacterium]|nr:LacI family DNA-binding transcriptional regulator [Saprospiraceae bacterium]